MNVSVPQTDLELFNNAHGGLDEFKALPEYKLKIRRFANNTIDMVMTKCNFKGIQKERFIGESTFYPKKKTDMELEQAKIENVERAARRAKQAVHHLVRSMGADHMLTLNTRENIVDYDRFDDIFKRFIRLVREKDLIGKSLHNRTKKRDWAYVAVRETQERGALHMHIACVGKQDIPLLRACWYVALGGHTDDTKEQARGQIDVQSHTKRFSGETEIFKTFKLVGYLTKYISKTFDESQVLGQRRYKASREIPKPTISKQYLHASFSYGEKPFLDAFEELKNIAYFEGVDTAALDYEIYNKGLDLLILRANIY